MIKATAMKWLTVNKPDSLSFVYSTLLLLYFLEVFVWFLTLCFRITFGITIDYNGLKNHFHKLGIPAALFYFIYCCGGRVSLSPVLTFLCLCCSVLFFLCSVAGSRANVCGHCSWTYINNIQFKTRHPFSITTLGSQLRINSLQEDLPCISS